jgi:DNA-binding NarL/FixJ family response regulator
MKYLCIDDNKKIRKIIRQFICHEEDSFIECADGSDALLFFCKHLPDYVLMDIQMKTMNGINATKVIHEQFPDARILIVTDHDTPAYREAAQKAGALAFFSKENLLELKKFILSTN